MMTYLVPLTLCFAITIVYGLPPQNQFFRKDYTYIEETQNFYKIHTIHRTWQDAKKRCSMEGAKLFYPEDRNEVDSVIKFWNKTQPFHWIYVGISDLLSKGAFETFDGIPIDDVYNGWASGEPNDKGGNEDCVILRRNGELNDNECTPKYPFICKKSLSSLEWNLFCDMPDPSYRYNAATGKCYKFQLQPMNWTDAYSMCNAEQSYLAVINSQKEAEILVKITEEAPKSKVKGNYLAGAVLLGFHNRDGDGWKTIKGTSIEDSGYSAWGNQQPDNSGKNEVCGSMFYNGKLNDINCERICFYICEHDISTLSNSYDDRIGSSP